jgi:hypothetical protein
MRNTIMIEKDLINQVYNADFRLFLSLSLVFFLASSAKGMDILEIVRLVIGSL